jgi:uncharacterized alkaline shock family protein YloU
MTHHTPPEPRNISDAQIADTAARQAMSVPGVLRLQPGLRHVVGRAARALLTPLTPGATQDDRAGNADGVDIRRAPDPEITLRLVTTVHPPPSVTARAVQDLVSQTVHNLTGRPATVIVVVVDTEDEDERI